MFMESVVRNPDKPALICEDLRWSYRELGCLVNRAAFSLFERYGVRKGDRVAVLLNNCPEFVVLDLAVTSLGGIFVPLNARLKARELVPQIFKAKPKVLIAGEDTWV